MKNQTKKQLKSISGLVYAQGDLSAFERNTYSDKNTLPLSGSYLERKDTESFVKYVNANYKDGQKITQK